MSMLDGPSVWSPWRTSAGTSAIYVARGVDVGGTALRDGVALGGRSSDDDDDDNDEDDDEDGCAIS